MHEMSVVRDLVARAEVVVTDAGARRASRVWVRLGVLSHLSPRHLESHFRRAAVGSLVEGAELVIEVVEDPLDPHSEDLIVTSVDVVWDG